MFTGLVEEVGRVKWIERGGLWAGLGIQAEKVLGDLSRGDSIAVNGVCLTVTEPGNGSFAAEVMAETLARTNLGDLEAGSRVNLERAVPLGGRLGGHLVSGHVDGQGLVTSRQVRGIATLLSVRVSPELSPYVVTKGSVTLDGVSLTITESNGPVFSVSLVTHTLQETTLGEITVGRRVNVEVDLIARYLAGLLAAREGSKAPGGLTEELLAEYGFR